MDYNRNFDVLAFLGIPADANIYEASGVRYTVVTPSANDLISLDFFKEHARIDFDTDDTLAQAYIKAAQEYLEQWSQLSFGVRTMRLTALALPNNYKLMFGPVNEVTTEGFENIGDILKTGGRDIDIQFTTLGLASNNTLKIAVARFACGLYVYRENILETKLDGRSEMDKAKEMVAPFMNITIF